MRSNMNRVCALLLVFIIPMMLMSCSSGGSGSGASTTGTTTTTTEQAAATALQVADKVSVVDAKPSLSGVAGVAPLHIGLFKVTAADFAETTDYKLDKTQIWVSERSAEAFESINSILCAVGQTKYDVMMNTGNYVALVDNTQCDQDRSDVSTAAENSQNQSSSSDMPSYSTFVINSSRADNSSPLIAKVWVHEEPMPGKNDPEMLIYVKLTITESKSDANPYGLFHMEFLGHPSTNGVADTNNILFKGVLKSERDSAGQVLLKFAEQNFGDWAGIRRIALNRQSDGSGMGSVSDQHQEMMNGSTTTVSSQFDIAFNPDYFLRTKGAETICLDRNAFDESAWRYGLYDTTGARVNRNSGFSVNTKADGSGSYGFVGYWGLWIDNNATITDNTLYKFDYSSAGAAPKAYTIFTADGKLKKHTKKTMTLAEIKGIPLNYSECDQSSGCMNYQVVWDGTNFNKTAQMPQCTGDTPCNWENLATPIPIDTTTLQWGELNFWSQSLGGQVRVPLSNCIQTFPTCTTGVCQPPTTTCDAPANTMNIIFFAEDLVYPTDSVPASLACYDNCPQVGSNGEAYTNMMSSGPSNTATTYTFDSSTMLLMTTGTSPVPVVMTVASTNNQWGVMSGAMFEPTSANIALLACDWNPSETCGYKAWSALNVFYTWETGPGNWNQFSALKDETGAFLTFEPPLSVKYVHHQAGSPLDGATFMLDYSGFGNLNGIPGKCVDMDSGLEAQCQNDPKIRYVPAFVIPAATDGVLTEVTADTTGGTATYYVKPLELEQRMKKDEAGCTGLTTTSYTLPDLTTEWSDPAIGTEPTVTSAPAVIGGVVQ